MPPTVPRRSGLKDVARQAGVSVASVSRILNHEADRFSDETVKRVRESAAALQYRPNAMARSLFSGSSRMAGVMIPAGGFYAQVLNGLHQALFDRGHLMLHAWSPHYMTNPDDCTEARIIHELVERSVDGVIVRPSSEEFARHYFEEIWRRNIPLIVIDRELALFKAHFVGSDDVGMGRAAAEHLLALGHRRLLFVGGSSCSPSARRCEGFRALLSEVPAASCRAISFDVLGDTTELVSILQSSDAPTGIYCFCDNTARTVLQVLEARGLRVPEDISVVGGGNLEVCPQLTTFDQQGEEIGRQAAELYLSLLAQKGGQIDPISKRLPAKLIVRRTTGPAPLTRTRE